MTDHPLHDPNESNRSEKPSTSIVVPGDPGGHLSDEERAIELQQARDLGSASRSCMAIIVVLLILALVLCVFLFWAFVIA